MASLSLWRVRLHTAPARVRALPSRRGPRGALWRVLVYGRTAGGQAGRLAGAAAWQSHCWGGAVRGRAAHGPSGLPSAALGPGRCGHLGGEGGGQGVPWPGGEGQGRRPPSGHQHSAGSGGGGVGRARVVQSLCSLPTPRSISRLRCPPGGCGGCLEGLG